MDVALKLTVLLSVVLNCYGATIREQLAQFVRNYNENKRYQNDGRRFNMRDDSVILGAPSFPNHLPEAEPILPGHTLLRPAMGMLKSALKFPHKDLDNGAGVYGNINNLGLRYDSRNERVMYSGFRRSPTDFMMVEPYSDSRPEEITDRLRLKRKNDPRKNIITKHVKVFPAYPKGKSDPLSSSNVYPKKQRLIAITKLPEPIDNRYGNKKKFPVNRYFDPTYFQEIDPVKKIQLLKNDIIHGRFNRNSKRSLDSRLLTSVKTLSFAQKLLKKLRANRPRRELNIVVLQPKDDIQQLISRYDNLRQGIKEKAVLKKAEDLMSLQKKKAVKFMKDLLKRLANRQRRQQNVVILKPEDNGPRYGSGVDQIMEDLNVPVTERPRNWFYKDKDAFNHVKISLDAPDYEDYLPQQHSSEDKNIKKWWYYHQTDFVPFDIERDN